MAFLEAADVLAINRGLSGAPPQAIDDKSDPDYDWHLLRDAINRHKNRVEQYPGVYEQGAALWHSLANASPFKSHQAETAFLALYAFMRENDLEFDVDEAYVSDFIGARDPTRADMAVFLGRHCHPSSDS